MITTYVILALLLDLINGTSVCWFEGKFGIYWCISLIVISYGVFFLGSIFIDVDELVLMEFEEEREVHTWKESRGRLVLLSWWRRLRRK